MASAALILKSRVAHRDGLIEMVVWRVPEPVPPTDHGFKYRLVYVVEGRRLVGYDNERGKGDHKHVGNLEVPYRFIDVRTLMADFLKDVERVR